LICRLVIYPKQSITFGSNNLTIKVLAFLPQCSTIMCEHLGSPHCIMSFYKEVHLGLVQTKMNYTCIGLITFRT
jgi:hypothetical protein